MTLLVAVWVLLRVLPLYDHVFPEGETGVLLGNDPWFHLHQCIGAAEHFPSMLRWDIGAFYPEGSRAGAAGFFNLGIGGLGRLISGSPPSADILIRLLAWSPIVFGALSLIALYFVVKGFLGSNFAILACTLRVLFPSQELGRTLLGFGDYHAAEILFSILILWTFILYARRMESRPSVKVSMLYGLLCSIPLTLLLFTWAGAPLYVAIIIATFWINAFVSMRQGRTDLKQTGLHWPYFGSILLLYGSFSILFPDWIMKQKAFPFTCGALFAQMGICFALALLPEKQSRSLQSRALIALLTLLLLVAGTIWMVSPPLRRFAEEFLLARNPFVAEHTSVGFVVLWKDFGPLLFWIPLALIFAFRRSTAPLFRFAIFYCFVWILLWGVTKDLGYTASSLIPILTVCGFKLIFDLAREKRRSFMPAVIWGGAVSLLVACALMIPDGWGNRPWMRKGDYTGIIKATKPWRDSLTWLREHSPELPLTPTALVEPWIRKEGFDYPPGSYGVLCHWQNGNLVNVFARRFVISARGSKGKFIRWFLSKSDTASHRALKDLGDVRYVVVDATSVCECLPGEILRNGGDIRNFQVVESIRTVDGIEVPIVSFGNDFRRSVGARLFLGDGYDLSRYRLVYESSDTSFLRYRSLSESGIVELRSTALDDEVKRELFEPMAKLGSVWREGEYLCYSGEILPTVKVFEIVRGARALGRISGTEPVKVQITLRCSITNRTFTYAQSETPDQEGKVSFLLPYPTGQWDDSSTVHSTGPYRVSVGENFLGTLEVSEEDVRKGRELALPQR